MHITATLKGTQLQLFQKNEVIRTINDPKHQQAYKFYVDGEECYFIYEEIKFRGYINRHLYLYPLGLFKNNKIEL